MIRSFLFVPADSEHKMQKAAGVNADALILDLEDSVAAAARPDARAAAREFATGRGDIWIRINPFDSDDSVADLDDVMAAAPNGVILPKPQTAADVSGLASRLDALEVQHGIDVGRTQIIALCTEHPQALLTLNGYVGVSKRLAGLSWGAEDLSAAVGASANRDQNGHWLPTYEMARSLCLVTAAAAGVPAWDTVFTDFRNDDGLREYARNARRDGFAGMLAVHPAQVEIINSAFVPTTEEIEHAQKIVALFDANPGTGTIGFEGKMIDRPHLVQAQQLLALAKRND